jgi:SAM-dependent methyltransferase
MARLVIRGRRGESRIISRFAGAGKLKPSVKYSRYDELMKIRESGMPDEAYWETLFDVPRVVDWFQPQLHHEIAELGCGYGTFTAPIAKAVTGRVYSFDIDAAMLARTGERTAGLPVVLQQRDVLAEGFGVIVDAVLLFNILHCEQPKRLLRQAADALKLGGVVCVIHWRHGETPRGPSLDIRPRPEQIIQWAEEAGLASDGEVVDLPPWHFGLKLRAQA